jgi:hypothetical protein
MPKKNCRKKTPLKDSFTYAYWNVGFEEISKTTCGATRDACLWEDTPDGELSRGEHVTWNGDNYRWREDRDAVRRFENSIPRCAALIRAPRCAELGSAFDDLWADGACVRVPSPSQYRVIPQKNIDAAHVHAWWVWRQFKMANRKLCDPRPPRPDPAAATEAKKDPGTMRLMLGA